MIHMHITSWALGIILLIIAIILQKQGKAKPAKIVHMILRLDYLFILYTGGSLLGMYFSNIQMPMFAEVIVKGIAGIWLIAAMEMILIKSSKGKSTTSAWVQFVIALLIVLVLGFVRLPLGIDM
ncbi:YisL family protein [Oceanobacillus chungangensis]|uniref:UPF0344 protein CWR45_07685 n=1 Tax=Oceanobacillus chungangensis TaxID=1229152 RepID=A0A3D8PV31_9BACI|nr:YisL family protein [Oceanobacillus chungangensis]RDW19933.1 hypothetical protein CWR45_07685 [Oceanobacillus chungangensis]